MCQVTEQVNLLLKRKADAKLVEISNAAREAAIAEDRELTEVVPVHDGYRFAFKEGAPVFVFV